MLEPLGRYCSYFPEVNEAIKRRQKKLLDYDSARSKVRKLVDRPSEDPQRLPRVSFYLSDIGGDLVTNSIDNL